MKFTRISIGLLVGLGLAGVTPVATAHAASTTSVTMAITCKAPHQPNCNSVTVGESINFSGNLSGVPNPTATYAYVDIEQDGVPIFMTYVDANGNYSQDYVTTPADLGTHAYTAYYDGSSSVPYGTSAAPYAATSPPVNFTVTAAIPLAATTTSLWASTTTPAAGQPVTFLACVKGSANPTGSVDFTVDGVSHLVALSKYAPCALFTTSFTSGTHTVIATYTGDTKNAPSTSSPVMVTAHAAPTDKDGDGDEE